MTFQNIIHLIFFFTRYENSTSTKNQSVNSLTFLTKMSNIKEKLIISSPRNDRGKRKKGNFKKKNVCSPCHKTPRPTRNLQNNKEYSLDLNSDKHDNNLCKKDYRKNYRTRKSILGSISKDPENIQVIEK